MQNEGLAKKCNLEEIPMFDQSSGIGNTCLLIIEKKNDSNGVILILKSTDLSFLSPFCRSGKCGSASGPCLENQF